MERRQKTSKTERNKQLESPGRIADLHYDVLQEILIRVARSSGGAKSLIRAVSACRAFWGLVEDRDVLRAVAFDKLLMPERCELFQHTGGLVTRCARAGHEKAQFILAKVLIFSSYKLESLITGNTDDDLPLDHYLKQRTKLYSFIEKFLPNPSGVPQRDLIHCDLVKLFLSQAKVTDFVEMQPYILGYVQYCFGSLSESFRFPPSCENAESLSSMLRKESQIFGAVLDHSDRIFTLIRDRKLKEEQALGLMRDCKRKHELIFVQLAEVMERDLHDADFCSLEFYEAVIEILQTIRQALMTEVTDFKKLGQHLRFSEGLEAIVLRDKMAVSSYMKDFANLISAFDLLCHHLSTGEKQPQIR